MWYSGGKADDIRSKGDGLVNMDTEVGGRNNGLTDGNNVVLDDKEYVLGERDDVLGKNDDVLGGKDAVRWKDDGFNANAAEKDMHASAAAGKKASNAKRLKCKKPTVGWSNN